MTLPTKRIANLELARVMADAAIREADEKGVAVSIAVMDDGGHPLLTVRMDGVAPVSAYIAEEKARTAAIARRETKLFETEINSGRTAFLSAPIKGALEGGVPLIVEGQVIASVGVAGCKPELSATIATAGVAAYLTWA
ncbi:glc operon protein GlcG [Paraburkholderia fungorum]|jgi:glc operon protein GlcG|uniref:GlcG/HbpS family heme-binding protein n=1 Tax=Paraburkholderia fungorum TaxID=134537 RepID=UPI000D068FFF|nr:heme-binding protein [Paraburkholderia fungorum]PRZ55836.1 glc operon protein GlcG [Paraburkholderia fungorum]